LTPKLQTIKDHKIGAKVQGKTEATVHVVKIVVRINLVVTMRKRMRRMFMILRHTKIELRIQLNCSNR
jgi:hypothetical protein